MGDIHHAGGDALKPHEQYDYKHSPYALEADEEGHYPERNGGDLGDDKYLFHAADRLDYLGSSKHGESAGGAGETSVDELHCAAADLHTADLIEYLALKEILPRHGELEIFENSRKRDEQHGLIVAQDEYRLKEALLGGGFVLDLLPHKACKH